MRVIKSTKHFKERIGIRSISSNDIIRTLINGDRFLDLKRKALRFSYNGITIISSLDDILITAFYEKQKKSNLKNKIDNREQRILYNKRKEAIKKADFKKNTEDILNGYFIKIA